MRFRAKLTLEVLNIFFSVVYKDLAKGVPNVSLCKYYICYKSYANYKTVAIIPVNTGVLTEV